MKEKTDLARQDQNWYTDLSDQVQNNKYIIHEYFDLEFTRQIIENVLMCLNKCFFRPEFIGFENYPERNNPDIPLIFASNHSGMAFPWDGIMLVSGIYKMFNYTEKSFRPLTSPMLSESTLMNPFMYHNLWKIVGSVDASFLNFETMMHQKEHNLLIYPEGVPGIGKGFNHRYHLQPFSTSFLTMSIKYHTDIVPILTVNGEYINPLAYRIGWLNKLVNKIGVPYLPIGPVSMLLPFQPWVFYSALPAKLTYVLGKTIRPYEMTKRSIQDISRPEILAIRDEVQQNMQQQLNEAVHQYGKSPYQMGEFLRVTVKKYKKFPYSWPFGWPLIFSEFNRVWNKSVDGKVCLRLGFLSFWRILIQRPFNIWYFIPFLGWIPILMQGIKLSKKRHNHS